MDTVSKNVLQRNHCLLVNNLDLTRSSVLDRLHEEDVISSGEQEDIMRWNTSRDQNARLLFLLKRRDPSAIKAFLSALEAEYGFIVKQLKSTQETEALTQERSRCLHCTLLQVLIPNDVTHFLYEVGIISDDDLNELNNHTANRQNRVKRLLELLQDFPSRNLVDETFISSLRPKYTYLLNSEVQIKTDHFLSCRCEEINGHLQKGVADENEELLIPINKSIFNSDDTSSLNSIASLQSYQPEQNLTKKYMRHISKHSDICTIQDESISVTPVRLLENNTVSIVDDSLACRCKCASKSNIEQKYIDHCVAGTQTLCTYKDKIQLPLLGSDASSVDSGGDKHKVHSKNSCKSKTVHASPKYQREGIEEPDAAFKLVIPKSTNKQAGLMLMSHLTKVYPNNNKLMKMCKKLWDQLFLLREKGEWETFSLVTSKALEKFHDNPDIQVLLYRSEMCVSTFYKRNEENANQMYEKALDLVPMTTMPTWHLTRILPLKVELCTKAKQFEESSNLLEQAHQVMTSLAPCLSTGAVYFFEALYLSALLRSSRSGTKTTAAIANKVKMCFLTAIAHYQQEPFFAIESFLNQVYLFLALFSLGVDCKYVNYFGIKDANADDIGLAEHYLNLFENCCWEQSTIWSRMLFFIGRGEQHKLKNSFQRSLDYFINAQECAVQGGFTEHYNFIDKNIQLLNDRLVEHLRLQEIQSKSADDILKSILESSDESGSGE